MHWKKSWTVQRKKRRDNAEQWIVVAVSVSFVQRVLKSHSVLLWMKFVEGERRFWNMSLTLGAVLSFHEQLMNVHEPEETLFSMYTAPPIPPVCLHRSKKTKKETRGCNIYTKWMSKKNISWKKMNGKRCFWIEMIWGHIICILFAFYQITLKLSIY